MNKFRSIDLLLQHLAHALTEGRIAVVADHWQDDEQAIGFYKPGTPDLAARVTTHGQPPGWYDIGLEHPRLADNGITNVPTTTEDVTLNDVLGMLATHFDLGDLGLKDD